jgi:acetyl esterase
MPLHPLSKGLLEQFAALPPLEQVGVAAGRKQMMELARMLPPGQPVARVEDRLVPGPVTDTPVRIYTPQGTGSFGILVYFHGGGWVLGSLESSDAACRNICNGARCIVVSVNYRHAPEHKCPAAAEDSYAATVWAARNAASLGGDAQRLAVGGSSAGGNLAAVTALMARDRGGPQIRYQLLMVPVLNHAYDTRSYQDNAEGYGLTRARMQWFWDHYLGSAADGANVYASPLRAPDFTGLPPAFVMTAEFDPLRDEGEAYAERLREAGVAVKYKCYEGMVHMLLGPEADQDLARELGAALAR